MRGGGGGEGVNRNITIYQGVRFKTVQFLSIPILDYETLMLFILPRPIHVATLRESALAKRILISAYVFFFLNILSKTISTDIGPTATTQDVNIWKSSVISCWVCDQSYYLQVENNGSCCIFSMYFKILTFWPNSGLMLAHCLRRWANIIPALGQTIKFIPDRKFILSTVLDWCTHELHQLAHSYQFTQFGRGCLREKSYIY